jgi:hypothetical protein
MNRDNFHDCSVAYKSPNYKSMGLVADGIGPDRNALHSFFIDFKILNFSKIP